MTHDISMEPSGLRFRALANETLLSAAMRQGVGLPYGCKDGACGSCKCRKISGTVVHGPHQDKALSADEEAQGLVLTCCATAQSDVVLESRQVTAEDGPPVKKMPVRVVSMEKKSQDVIVLKLQLPANDLMRFYAGQYIEFLLRDGSRRSYSMANAPHTLEVVPPTVELHIRHMPGGKFTDQVFTTMREKDILRAEGPKPGCPPDPWIAPLSAHLIRSKSIPSFLHPWPSSASGNSERRRRGLDCSTWDRDLRGA